MHRPCAFLRIPPTMSPLRRRSCPSRFVPTVAFQFTALSRITLGRFMGQAPSGLRRSSIRPSCYGGVHMRRLFLAIPGLLVVVCLLIAELSPPEAQARGGSSGYRGGGHSSGGHVGVRPHTRRDGTFVQPHRRTAPNSTQRDNFTSKPNSNPYTGKPGTREPQR